MPDLIKKISIVGTPNDTRDIGAEAQNIIVSYDANGDIIEDITAPGVVVDHTGSVAEALTNTTPDDHADPTDKYGPGDATNYGHIKLGTGLERNITTGATDVKYGTTAGTAAQGNDSRLSDDRKNPNAVTFSDGAATPTTESYDGSAAKTVTYQTVGAAPKSHASSTTEYGIATTNNYGHIKVGDGLAATQGVLRVNADGSTIVVNADGTISATAGEGGHITLHQSEYDALTPEEKADPNKFYFIDDVNYDGETRLTGTLTAGSTSISFTSSYLTATSLIDVYTAPIAVNPITATTSGTTITLTFAEQADDISVVVTLRD